MAGKKPNKTILAINLILLFAFIAGVIYISVKYVPSITRIIRKPDRVRDFLASYKSISILVFIFLQVIQVVIAAIPGEFVQLAGGYVYGTFLGTVYSLSGITLGSAIAFYISRLLGLRTLRAFIPPKTFDRFNFLMNNPKVEIAMFILFLIPFTPKDTLVYLAGLTPMKPKNFFPIFAAARFPTILLSSFIGANIQERDYKPIITVSAIVSILLVFCLIYKDKLVELLHKSLPSRKNPNQE